MKPELKVKVLDALKESQPTCFTKENVYKCANDGMVCFNGMIAELVNGMEYEADHFEEIAWERAQEEADEALMEQVTNELASNDLWDEIPAAVQDQIIDKRFESVREDYDIDTSSEIVSMMADAISEDLEAIYQDPETLRFINETHYNWITNQIDFDLAMAEVERHIVENE